MKNTKKAFAGSLLALSLLALGACTSGDVQTSAAGSDAAVVPDKIEFWEDRPGRQHWRTLFTRTADGWAEGLLFP